MKITQADREAAKIAPQKIKMSEIAKEKLRLINEHARQEIVAEEKFVAWFAQQSKTYEFLSQLLYATGVRCDFWRRVEKLGVALRRWPQIQRPSDLVFLSELTRTEQRMPNAAWMERFPAFETIDSKRVLSSKNQHFGYPTRRKKRVANKGV